MNNERYNDKITLYGNKAEIEEAKKILAQIQLSDRESEDRLLLQNEVMDKIKARLLYDGNSVYSKTKVINRFKRLIKKGMDSLPDDLYQFFHLCCGSIAHYNKYGWISEYPDLSAIKEFFKHNEYGQSVLAHQPHWATDRIEIIKEMEKLLHLSA